MNEGRSSDSGEVKSVTDPTEIKYVVMACARKGGNLSEKDKLESKMNPSLVAEEVGEMSCV